MRDDLLNLERFDTPYEENVLTERWRHVYNKIRLHSSLGYRPLGLASIAPKLSKGVTTTIGEDEKGRMGRSEFSGPLRFGSNLHGMIFGNLKQRKD